MRGAVPEPQGRLAESRREATRDWKPRLIGQHGGGVDFLDVSYILFQKTTSLILRNRIPSSPSCSPSFYFPALELRWAKFIRNPLNLSQRPIDAGLSVHCAQSKKKHRASYAIRRCNTKCERGTRTVRHVDTLIL